MTAKSNDEKHVYLTPKYARKEIIIRLQLFYIKFKFKYLKVISSY